jgi:hypothetical protein
VVVLYFRMGLNSVDVAGETGLKPPHVRQLLYRLRAIWIEKFKVDLTVQPSAPAVPPCRTYTRQEIEGALNAGIITIPKDIPPALHQDDPLWTKPWALVRDTPHIKRSCSNAQPRYDTIDADRAAQLRATGLSWKEVAEKLGNKNVKCVWQAVRNAGLLVPSDKHGPRSKLDGHLAAALEMRHAGHTCREIAEKFGVDYGCVWWAFKKADQKEKGPGSQRGEITQPSPSLQLSHMVPASAQAQSNPNESH